jgi:hypothetical protein
MKVISATRNEENGRTIVKLRFKTREQLLDPDDPSPISERELTQEAEDAIINNVFAGRLKKPVTLEIQVPGVSDPGVEKEITGAIRHHFRFVLSEHERDTAIFIRERRMALAFTGLNILIAGLYGLYAYLHVGWVETIGATLLGALVIIINWATIWDTYEFFIFDGREKSQRKKLLNKIIDGEIRVIPVTQESRS